MAEPLVSVIVPAFNSAATIRRALDSAFAQSYKAIEVIVVDDGSVDASADLVRQSGYPINLIVQANRGPGAARNVAARAARGDYLAFLDADDVWHHHKLALQMRALTPRVSAALCYTRRVTQPRGGAWRFDATAPLGEPTVTEITDFRRVFLDPFFGTTTVVMRAEIFNACGGFDESLETGEDIDLWLRASYHRTVLRVDADLAGVGYVTTSLTSRVGERTYADSLRVLESFVAAQPEFASEHPGTVRAARSIVRTNLASELLTLGEPQRAREVLNGLFAAGAFSARAAYLYVRSFLPAIRA